MVLLNVELDNILLFNNFSLNLSYPKKIVGSAIEEEHLDGRKNFRYKKVIILMGANATGKTALGKALRGIFNFIARREYAIITELIEDPKKDASFSVDLAFPDYRLFRVETTFKSAGNKRIEYKSEDVSVRVKSVVINKNDSYETCSDKLEMVEEQPFDNYVQALETIPFLTWKFEMPFASNGMQNMIAPVIPDQYTMVLEQTLRVLDPRIENIEQIKSAQNTYIIRYRNHSVLIKDGVVMEADKLSSGTVEGIGIADLITAMHSNVISFFFCDEKFSHVHSAVEKAFLSVMINMLKPNQQIFFTSHNTDICDMNIPLHSYALLRRDEFDDNTVSCVFASDYLKKNTESLKNAVDNDVFSATPNTDGIYAIVDLYPEVSHE